MRSKQIQFTVYGRSYVVILSSDMTPKQVVRVLNSANVPLRVFVGREIDHDQASWQVDMRNKIARARNSTRWLEIIAMVINGRPQLEQVRESAVA